MYFQLSDILIFYKILIDTSNYDITQDCDITKYYNITKYYDITQDYDITLDYEILRLHLAFTIAL